MFADGIPDSWIYKILAHCEKYHHNMFIFQTKNPKRAYQFKNSFPMFFKMGTTIETNKPYPSISKAPPPLDRYIGIHQFAKDGIDTFVTIEPILDFDVDILVDWLKDIKPDFINIGADSKRCSLLEPSPDKVKRFIALLQKNNINIKKKINLGRLLI